MKNHIKIFALFITVASCTPINDIPLEHYSFSGGVFILNEGNFRGGNGSLSFYSYDSTKFYNDIFSSVNDRPLGDVPNSMVIREDKAYIVVNNSGKIEVVDQSTLVSEGTITGLISPRNIALVDAGKAYVTSIYSDSVAVVNLNNNTISGYINLKRSSESIIVAGKKAFISNWFGGNEIMVVNTLTNKVADSIVVGIEPESMVIDRNGIVWVLCNGGWTRQNYAELIGINSTTNHVEKRLVFPTKDASPSCLNIDGNGQTLYYLDNGVRKMDIAATELPSAPFILQESGEYFYKIGINPFNTDVFITDAVDFTQKGSVMIYTDKGIFISKYKAGIIPGSVSFQLKVSVN